MEGPLNNLKQSMVQFQKPRRVVNERRMYGPGDAGPEGRFVPVPTASVASGGGQDRRGRGRGGGGASLVVLVDACSYSADFAWFWCVFCPTCNEVLHHIGGLCHRRALSREVCWSRFLDPASKLTGSWAGHLSPG